MALGPHLGHYNLMAADTHARWLRAELAIRRGLFPEDTGKRLKVDHPRANPPCFQ